MQFKYLNQLKDFPSQPCPCLKKFGPKSVLAFRFLYKNATVNDFIPAYIKNPQEVKSCEGYALSFFESQKAAKIKFDTLSERVDAKSIYGDHIGEISLVVGDGVMAGPNKSGHLSLHEFEGAVFHNRVTSYFPL